MREHKYRAWHKKAKQFCYFSLISGLDNGYAYRNGPSGNLPGKFDTSDFEEPQDYTGIKDKFENEIWEGDIVKGSQFANAKGADAVGEVCWDENLLIWVWQYQNGERISPLWNLRTNKYAKVIGNIYETPELMK